jgi:uncharacterized membrane protein YhhN
MLPFTGGLEAQENGAFLLSAAAALLYAFIIDLKPSVIRSVVKTLSTALLAYLAWRAGGTMLLVAGLALSGLASFLAAHLAYIKLFAENSLGLAELDVAYWRLTAMAVVVVFAMSFLVVLLKRAPPTLRLPIVAYTLTIMAMGVTSLAVANVWVMIGAALFIASDALLAWERFVSPAISSARPLMRRAVWVLYYAAQLLIMLGFVLVR